MGKQTYIMKKVIVLLMLFVGSASAQLRDKNFHLGILFSGNSTGFTADPTIGEITPDFGYGASAFARLRFLMLYGELEIGYMEHKVIVAPVTSSSTVNSNYTLSGLDLTGLIGWRVFGIGSLGNLRLFTGLNYGNYTKISIESNGAQQNNGSVNKGNTGIVGGIGVDLWKIVLNMKYIYGLSNLTSEADHTINSQCTSISLGFKF